MRGVNGPQKKILIYDGSCATCRVMMSAADKTTTGYDFVDAHSADGKRIVAERNLDIEESAYLIESDRVASHSDMALEILHDVRFIGPLLAAVARSIPLRARESMYAWLVRHRIR